MTDMVSQLLQLTFNTLDLNKNQSEDLLIQAKDLLNELFRIARQRTHYRPLGTFLINCLDQLKPNVMKLADSDDRDLAEAYQDIFIDAARNDLTNIVEHDKTESL